MKYENRASFGWPACKAASAPCDQGLVLHYDGANQGLATKPHEACRDYWKRTRKFHMGPSRGWSDIGYAFGVCPHGVIFEGRGWKKTQAASPGANTTWTNVTFCSGDAESPTQLQVEAFKQLRVWLQGKGLKNGIKGHRDFYSTSCPGKILYGMVQRGEFAGKPPASGKPNVPEPTLQVGSKGGAVVLLQRALNYAQGGPDLAVDGSFGVQTKAALRVFQKTAKLVDDGIYGPASAKALAAAIKAK